MDDVSLTIRIKCSVPNPLPCGALTSLGEDLHQSPLQDYPDPMCALNEPDLGRRLAHRIDRRVTVPLLDERRGPYGYFKDIFGVRQAVRSRGRKR